MYSSSLVIHICKNDEAMVISNQMSLHTSTKTENSRTHETLQQKYQMQFGLVNFNDCMNQFYIQNFIIGFVVDISVCYNHAV